MSKRIEALLESLFDKSRIVFWDDKDSEVRDTFEKINLSDVTKVVVENDEFSVKYRVMREEPKQKFLLYRPNGYSKNPIENWLLDLQLASQTFSADRKSLWVTEMGLDRSFLKFAEKHQAFYEGKNKDSFNKKLKNLINPESETEQSLELKMLAVATGTEPHFYEILFSLLREYANDESKLESQIQALGLHDALWTLVREEFDYSSDSPSIADFTLNLFETCFHKALNQDVALSNNALVFMSHWKDNRRYIEDFKKLALQCADSLNVEKALDQTSVTRLGATDYFPQIDWYILGYLFETISNRTSSYQEIESIVQSRLNGIWYADENKFNHLYQAALCGSKFLKLIQEMNYHMTSFDEGLKKYTQSWFVLDQLHRQFTYHVLSCKHKDMTSTLFDLVDNLYCNEYLLKVNNAFSNHVAKRDAWNSSELYLQRRFFSHYIEPIVTKGNKAAVIISDALRYEIGDEFKTRLQQFDRLEAEIKPMLAMLPTYTQLGMASLLPQADLTVTKDKRVNLDGISSAGLENRKKILQKKVSRSTVMEASTILQMDSDRLRDVAVNHDLLYVYHDRIDMAGEASPNDVFKASEESLNELTSLVKKLTNGNFNTIFVTADHGFLLQNRVLHSSDYCENKPQVSDSILDRRFVAADNLADMDEYHKFTASQLGLSGELDFLFPRSIKRIRKQGDGGQYVHGGISLQEIVVPVVKVKRMRSSSVHQTEVVLLNPRRTITSNVLHLEFSQEKPVTDKVHGRTLRIGLFDEDGNAISSFEELNCQSDSDNPHDRQFKVMLKMKMGVSATTSKKVTLKLEELVPKTNRYSVYQEFDFQYRRSFGGDFDF